MSKEKGLKNLPAGDPQRMACERTRRKYVKTHGGLIKGLTTAQVEEAQEACAAYGRPIDQGWDTVVVIGAMGA